MRNPFSALYPRKRPRKRDFRASKSPTDNPMFSGSAHPRRTWPWTVVLTTLLIIGGGMFVLISPRFRITTVRVEGASKLDPVSIASFVHEQLNRTFVGVAWRRVVYVTPVQSLTQAVSEAAEKLVPLASVGIEKTDRNTVTVRLAERVPDFLWEDANGNRYFIDNQGVVLGAAAETLVRDLPTIIDANNLPTDVGAQVVKASVLEASNKVRERLPSLHVTANTFSTWEVECPDTSHVQVPSTNTNTRSNSNANFNTNSDEAEEETDVVEDVPEPVALCDADELALDEQSFVVTTNEGWEIRFTGATDIHVQLEKLATTLRERITRTNNLDYIDVRFGDRVFFQ